MLSGYDEINELGRLFFNRWLIYIGGNNVKSAVVVTHSGALASLGVNVIWLKPVQTNGGPLNSLYCISNFYEFDDEYGTLTDLRNLVLEANADGYRCDAADYVPFDFWQKAIDCLRSIPNKEIIMLAEGVRTDHFDTGFDMNFDLNFYNKGKDIF